MLKNYKKIAKKISVYLYNKSENSVNEIQIMNVGNVRSVNFTATMLVQGRHEQLKDISEAIIEVACPPRETGHGKKLFWHMLLNYRKAVKTPNGTMFYVIEEEDSKKAGKYILSMLTGKKQPLSKFIELPKTVYRAEDILKAISDNKFDYLKFEFIA